MKALTIRAPWAHAVAFADKRTENRSWPTKYRGPLAVHAGLSWDAGAEHDPALIHAWPALAGPGDPDRPTTDSPAFAARGAVLAVAELVDVHADARCCRPWGRARQWHWVMTDVVPLGEPVPARGSLGLWRPTADVCAVLEDR